MDDLISRQALCEYALNQKDKSVTPNDIMRFPSAQPEIIRCKDCKHKYLDDMVWNCPFGLPGGENFFCGYGAMLDLPEEPKTADSGSISCKKPENTHVRTTDDLISRQKLKDGFKEMCDLNCPYTEKEQHIMCGSCMMGTAFDVLEATASVPDIKMITAHLKQRLWETALNNISIKGVLGDAYADIAQNRLDVWMNEIVNGEDK